MNSDVLAILTADQTPRQVLLTLVRTLDLRQRAASRNQDEQTTAFVNQFLARSVLATADLAAKRTPRAHEGISATRLAAAEYVREPTSQRWADFFRAATLSYPFGPGDGCLAVDEIGEHGVPGAGCASGVGFIAHVGTWVGDASTVAALRAELVPWLSLA